MSAADTLPPEFALPLQQRIRLTSSCRDAEVLPRAADAGAVGEDAQGAYQVMHNGVRVVRGGYCGAWMEEIIRRLRGVHEPQEERVFHEAVQRMPAGATMLELGGYWAWYSLWLRSVVPDARNFVVEPDPGYIAVGRANFARNGLAAEFTQACVGSSSRDAVRFACESDGQTRDVPQICVDDYLAAHGIERVDMLHADIQGAEIQMLKGARAAMAAGRIRFLFLSTHHHSISGDPLTHQHTISQLRKAGARILVDHTVAESFSGDGLVVASFDPRDADLEGLPLSRCRASDNFFREIEYDLADAWAELETLRNGRSWRPGRRIARWLGRSAP